MSGIKMDSSRYEMSNPRCGVCFLSSVLRDFLEKTFDEHLLKLLRNVTSADINDICHFHFISCI